MKIRRLKGLEEAGKARGMAIVIDVMRAATVEAFALALGAKYILPVASKEEAFELKKSDSSLILLGEEQGIKVEGFDLGNSPSELLEANLQDKVIVHRSTFGTRGLVAAQNTADELIFGSLVTAQAIEKFVKNRNPWLVSIVSLGSDDEIAGDYLEALIFNKKVEKSNFAKRIYNLPEVAWFLDEAKKDFPLKDLELALDFDRFNFVCLVEKEGGRLVTRKAEL